MSATSNRSVFDGLPDVVTSPSKFYRASLRVETRARR
jgi:hypothetical protein